MKRLAVILCLLTTGILNGHAQQFSNLVTDPASIAKLDLVSYIEEHELQDLQDLYMVLISIDDATVSRRDIQAYYLPVLHTFIRKAFRESPLCQRLADSRHSPFEDRTLEFGDLKGIEISRCFFKWKNTLRLLVDYGNIDLDEVRKIPLFMGLVGGSFHQLEYDLFGSDRLMRTIDPYPEEVFRKTLKAFKVDEYDPDYPALTMIGLLENAVEKGEWDLIEHYSHEIILLSSYLPLDWNAWGPDMLAFRSQGNKEEMLRKAYDFNVFLYQNRLGQTREEAERLASFSIAVNESNALQLGTFQAYRDSLYASGHTFTEYLPSECPEDMRKDELFPEYRERFFKEISANVFLFFQNVIPSPEYNLIVQNFLHSLFGNVSIPAGLSCLVREVSSYFNETEDPEAMSVLDLLAYPLLVYGADDVDIIRYVTSIAGYDEAKGNYLVPFLLDPVLRRMEETEVEPVVRLYADIAKYCILAIRANEQKREEYGIDVHLDQDLEQIASIPDRNQRNYLLGLMSLGFIQLGAYAHDNPVYADRRFIEKADAVLNRMELAPGDELLPNFYLSKLETAHYLGHHSDVIKYFNLFDEVRTEGSDYTLGTMLNLADASLSLGDDRLASKVESEVRSNMGKLFNWLIWKDPTTRERDFVSYRQDAEEVFNSVIKEDGGRFLDEVFDDVEHDGFVYAVAKTDDWRGRLFSSILYNYALATKGSLLRSSAQIQHLLKTNDDHRIRQFYSDTHRDGDLEVLLQNGRQNYASYLVRRQQDAIVFPAPNDSTVRERLLPDEVCVEFLDLEGDAGLGLAILVLRHDFEAPVLILVSTGQFTEEFGSLTNPDLYFDRKTNQALGKLLWAGVLPYLKENDTVYYSMDRDLNFINPEILLMPDRRQMADVFRMVRVSTTGQKPQPVHKEDIRQAILFGGIPVEGMDDITLSTRQEVETASSLLKKSRIKAETRVGKEGIKASFLDLDGKDLQLLHIATHGYVADGEESTLQRCKLAFFDGEVNAEDVAQMDLSAAKAVILSACESGAGETGSDGVFGLQRGFKQAGAGAALMTLWPVETEMTEQMISLTYKHFVGGMSLRDSFNAARQTIRDEHVWDDWAAFVLLD